MKKKFTPSETFGARLRQARLAAGLTQAAVAAHICVDRSTYTKYELGLVEPSLVTAYHLSRLLDTTLDDLLRSER